MPICRSLGLALLASLLWLGNPTAIAAPARIVSLSPHTTEMLYAIGAGPALVAVDEASDWPMQARQLPRVANFQSLNTEALLALHPDLVVLWRGASARVETILAPFGIPVLSLRSQQLADLPLELRRLGRETGRVEAAERLASELEQRLASLKQRYGHQPRVRLFYQLWSPPLMTVAEGTWIQEAIALCGGDNPFAASPMPYPQVSEEAVLAANPQLLLSPEGVASLTGWRRWPRLEAVRRNQLQAINADWLHRLGPRILDGIEQLCHHIDTARQATSAAEK